MNQIDLIKDKIKALPVTSMPVNAWENKKYKPYTVKLIDLDKVLEILSLIEDVNLK